MKRIIHNLVILLVSIAIYYIYIENYAAVVAEKTGQGLFLNITLLPFIFGAIACYLFRGYSIVRTLLVALIPIVALLPAVMGGGDPAKPGLERLVYLALIVSFCVGSFAESGVYYLRKYIKKKNTPNKSLKNGTREELRAP